MGKINKSRHDRLCDKMAAILENYGYDVDVGFEYGPPSKPTGEIDVLGYKSGHLIIMEVKSNPSKSNAKTAYKQLDKIQRYYVPRFDLPVNRVNLMYVTGQTTARNIMRILR